MKYVIKKTATMLITVLLVSFFVFLAFSIIPGDPAVAKLGTQATPEKVMALREQMGLNRPLLVRFVSWIKDFIFGDMGTSYSYSLSVKAMIADKFPITITLTILSFIFIMIMSVPLGLYITEHDGSIVSKAVDCINQVLMAIPPFFSGMLITYFFGIVLKLFVPGDFVSYKRSFGEFILYLIFPAIAIALPKSAMTIRMLKMSILSEAGKDYVRTAYSRGNTTTAVMYKHVLKNAFIPVITFLGMTLSDIVAGSLIVEQVFSIPGLGRLLVTSISNRDYPVVQAIIVLIVVIVVVINLLVDVLYRVIDPRIEDE